MLNSSVLLCTTPPRDALLPQTLLAPRSELDLTFDLASAAQLPASLELSGDAQMNEEALALTANCRNDKCRAVAALATERAKTAEYDEIERLVVAMRAGKVESVAVA